MGRAALPILCLLSGCFGDPTTPGGGGSPLDGPECATRHIAIGARRTDGTGGSVVVRFDGAGQRCRGLTIPEDELWSIAGLPDGSEVLGMQDRIMRVSGQSIVWQDGEGSYYGNRAISVALVTVEGRSLVAVVWGDTYDRADHLELRDVVDGAPVREYEVSGSITAVAPPVSGLADRLLLLHEYDGIQEHIVDLSADALGGATELEVLAPNGIGTLNSVDALPMHLGVASDRGVLRWTQGTSPAMLGPVACRYARYAGMAVPMTCGEIVSSALDPDDPERQVAICDQPMGGGFDMSPSVALRIGPRGDCEMLLDARRFEDTDITAVGWAGR